MALKLNHYKYIDALRGFAFLGVLTVHCANRTGFDPGNNFLGKAAYGVQLFFVLSAVTLLRSASLRSREPFAKRSFYIRRLCRIAPLFWFGILLYFHRHHDRPNFLAPEGVKNWYYLATFLFLHGWSPGTINSVVPGGWSIAVEMTFYLFLPFLAARITSLRASLAAAFCALVAAVLLNGWLGPVLARVLPASYHDLIPMFLFWWFPFQLPIFFLGFAVYHCLRSEQVKGFLAKPGRAPLLIVAGLGACLAAATLNLYSWGAMHVLYAVFFGMIILGLSARPIWLLVNPAMCKLGTISFSCYLTHFWALALVMDLLKPRFFLRVPHHLGLFCQFSGVWLAGLGLTVIFSTITYFAIEKPGIKLGNWIISRYQPPVAEPVLNDPRPSPRDQPGLALAD